jgi:hypothetical protein
MNKQGHCKDCRYWQYRAMFSDGAWGVCQLASHADGKHLYGDGGRGFIAGTLAPIKPLDTNLNTRESFGCVEFWAKAHE